MKTMKKDNKQTSISGLNSETSNEVAPQNKNTDNSVLISDKESKTDKIKKDINLSDINSDINILNLI